MSTHQSKRPNLGTAAIVHIDLEATSKCAADARIFGVAAIDSSGREFGGFVDPGRDIPDEVKQLCKLNSQDLDAINSAASWATICNKFIVWLEDGAVHKDRLILVAHNAKRYDIPLLEIESARHGISFRLSTGTDVSIVDTLELFDDDRLWEGIPGDKPSRLKLRDLYHRLCGRELDDAHSAMGDAKGLMKIIQTVDPELKKALQLDHLSPLSYANVDVSKLCVAEREIAEKSLMRERVLELLNPSYQNVALCLEVLDSIKAKGKTLQGVAGMSSEAASVMGCIEILGPQAKKPYPHTRRGGNTIGYHAVACVAGDGPKPLPKTDDWLDQLTASHICQNCFCFNPKHLKWETLRYNLSRCGCIGRTRWNGKKFTNTVECKHKPRCMNYTSIGASLADILAGLAIA